MADKMKILITGGSGLIGSRLTDLLLQKGYHVAHLGRKASNGTVKTYEWDVNKQTMDTRAFEGVSAIVHLAGANLSGQRWTKEFKREAELSRTQSTRMLVDFINKGDHQITQLVNGSAIGYYGADDSGKWTVETDPAGSDFTAELVTKWEAEAEKVARHGVSVARIRIGIVFSNRGGALMEMVKPVKYWVGAPLGTGRQFVSWIHIDDLCGIMMHAIENKLQGAFNACAPAPATNAEVTKAIAKVLHKPLILPPVPSWALKLILGEMSEIVVTGNKVSSEKIRNAGFVFQHPVLEETLGDILAD